MQKKLLKDLLTVTKIALYYDFPQTDQKLPWAAIKDEVETLCLCFGNHALQQQHERNNYNMKLNPEKMIFQHRLGVPNATIRLSVCKLSLQPERIHELITCCALFVESDW